MQFDANSLHNFVAQLSLDRLLSQTSINAEPSTAPPAGRRFDADKDGKMTEQEFHAFLLALAKSRVLPEDSPARIELKQKLIQEVGLGCGQSSVDCACLPRCWLRAESMG